MEKIAEYDPLPITAVEFNIKSATKYTSVTTVVLSLLILSFAVTVNFESIQKIWSSVN